MTPDQISTILGALARVEDKMDLKADKADILRLEVKVDRTNGRVTKLEAQDIRDEAKGEARDGLKRVIWTSTVATISAVGVLVAIAVAIIDHI